MAGGAARRAHRRGPLVHGQRTGHRRNRESDPETGGWDFTLYRDLTTFAAADQPTHITDWRTWNQAYLIIGLLMQALGYVITYRYATGVNN
ncbi:hypothetical protein FHX77_000324 [Bifidobacterium commune]|uniref:hypothetical protein n=1 Tax=Bifidobacterium commune TaxID=1505727 RepID=UPI0011785A02|nr:hypothetical protein [Bifidobacterium commune]MBB2954944.1 hypothetical protein [Bifidobacterium commune]